MIKILIKCQIYFVPRNPYTSTLQCKYWQFNSSHEKNGEIKQYKGDDVNANFNYNPIFYNFDLVGFKYTNNICTR